MKWVNFEQVEPTKTIVIFCNLICLYFWVLSIISSLDGRSLGAAHKGNCLFVPFLLDNFFPALTRLIILRKMYLSYSWFFSSWTHFAINRLFDLEYTTLTIYIIYIIIFFIGTIYNFLMHKFTINKSTPSSLITFFTLFANAKLKSQVNPNMSINLKLNRAFFQK